jgi:hypothetical protein
MASWYVYRQLAHRWRQSRQPYAPAALYSSETLFFCFRYSFLLAQQTSGPSAACYKTLNDKPNYRRVLSYRNKFLAICKPTKAREIMIFKISILPKSIAWWISDIDSRLRHAFSSSTMIMILMMMMAIWMMMYKFHNGRRSVLIALLGQNSVATVREQTILTERPLLVGEVSGNLKFNCSKFIQFHEGVKNTYIPICNQKHWFRICHWSLITHPVLSGEWYRLQWVHDSPSSRISFSVKWTRIYKLCDVCMTASVV